MTNWYVITGAPSSGKTTLLKDLEFRGHMVVPEMPRIVIDEALAAGTSVQTLRKNELEFQRTVLNRKLLSEHDFQPDQILFMDRGLGDCVAYFEFAGGKNDPDIVGISADHYKAVFLLDPLEFKDDYARTESVEDVATIDHLLEQTYTRLGARLVRVPVLPPAKRVKFILDML